MLLALLVASQPASPNPADNGIGIKPPMGCAYLPCLPWGVGVVLTLLLLPRRVVVDHGVGQPQPDLHDGHDGRPRGEARRRLPRRPRLHADRPRRVSPPPHPPCQPLPPRRPFAPLAEGDRAGPAASGRPVAPV